MASRVRWRRPSAALDSIRSRGRPERRGSPAGSVVGVVGAGGGLFCLFRGFATALHRPGHERRNDGALVVGCCPRARSCAWARPQGHPDEQVPGVATGRSARGVLAHGRPAVTAPLGGGGTCPTSGRAGVAPGGSWDASSSVFKERVVLYRAAVEFTPLVPWSPVGVVGDYTNTRAIMSSRSRDIPRVSSGPRGAIGRGQVRPEAGAAHP
jgi:hypothetical protein